MYNLYHGKLKIDFIKGIFHYYHEGKKQEKFVTAIARELAGFIWAISQEVSIEQSIIEKKVV